MNVEFINYNNSLVDIGQIRSNENNQRVLITDSEASDSDFNAINLTGEEKFRTYFDSPKVDTQILNEFPTLLNSAGIKVLMRND